MKSDVVWNAVYLEPSGDSFNYKAVASAVENIEAHLPRCQVLDEAIYERCTMSILQKAPFYNLILYRHYSPSII